MASCARLIIALLLSVASARCSVRRIEWYARCSRELSVGNKTDQGVSFMSTLTSLLDAKASRIAEQMDDLGRETAESLHAAASSIRKGSKAIEDLAESTANKLDGAGSYVEKHNVKRTIGES